MIDISSGMLVNQFSGNLKKSTELSISNFCDVNTPTTNTWQMFFIEVVSSKECLHVTL